MNRRPTPKALQLQCDKFNAACPVGTRVALNCDGHDAPFLTTTRTEAQILSGHSAVVWLNGVVGCYLISFVTPLGSAA